jgi:hypothetical protein
VGWLPKPTVDEEADVVLRMVGDKLRGHASEGVPLDQTWAELLGLL